MGKANKAKKKLWRSIPDASQVEVLKSRFQDKATTALPTDQLFVLDPVGDKRIAKSAYPEKFASERPALGPATHKQKKPRQLPVTKPEEPGLYDLWEDEHPDQKPRTAPLAHIPAVIPALPGQSYNPDSTGLHQTWEKVLQEEVAKDTENEQHKRMVHGFTVVEDDAEVHSSSEDGEANFIKNPVTQNRKPTKSKVNKKLRWMQLRKVEELQKQQKALLKEVDKIPQILTRMKKEDEFRAEEKRLEKKRKGEDLEAETLGQKAPKILMGQFKYTLPVTETQYTEESKPLRQLQAKASAVDTCFDSLVRRGRVDLYAQKKQPRIVAKNRYTGEVARTLQEERLKRQEEAKTGTIKMPGASH